MEKKSVKGTQTEKNLMAAFAGESQAMNRYNFYSKVASKEGYEQIADFFAETARNEEQHAKIYFKFLEGGVVELCASYPAGVISTTLANLMEGVEGEYEEWSSLYPGFAQVAENEGFLEIAAKFRMIAAVESHHEARFRGLFDALQADVVFKKKEIVIWRCLKCGYEYQGMSAPDKCPICDHPQAYFEIKNDLY